MGLGGGRAGNASFLAVIALEAIAGVIASLYVLIIILFDFYRRKNMRTGNKLRVALSFSNMLFSIVTSAGVFSGFFWPWLAEVTSSTSILYSLLMYTISSCSWLSAGMSFFYFVKIVRLKSGFFLWVKLKIGSVVSWLILVSEVVSLGGFLTVLLTTVPPDFSQDSSNGTFVHRAPGTGGEIRFVHVVIAVTVVPLLTVVFTCISTVVFLKQHKHKMEKKMEPSRMLQPYQSAACRMLRLLFFFLMFYSLLLVFYMTEFSELNLEFCICFVILSSFSAVQSVLLVLGNRNLRGAWKELLHRIIESRGGFGSGG